MAGPGPIRRPGSPPATPRYLSPIASDVDICIVGARLAGLHLAGLLDGSGLDCLLLDKGRSPGGRAATRRIGEARVDHGLPWLTDGGESSRGLIDRFRRDGLVEAIDAGGSVGTAWASPNGISSLMKHLAAGRNTWLSHRVTSVAGADGEMIEIEMVDEAGDEIGLVARHAVITAPMPQAVEIAPEIVDAAGAGAEDVYDKAIVGLFRLADGAAVPAGCLDEEPADGVGRVIVESAKYPGRPPSVSVRCDAEASDFLWERNDDEVWEWMASRLGGDPPLGAGAEERQVKRWRLSEAARPVPSPFLSVGGGRATLSACGDSFAAGGPTGVENALRSARALFDSRPWQA